MVHGELSLGMLASKKVDAKGSSPSREGVLDEGDSCADDNETMGELHDLQIRLENREKKYSELEDRLKDAEAQHKREVEKVENRLALVEQQCKAQETEAKKFREKYIQLLETKWVDRE